MSFGVQSRSERAVRRCTMIAKIATAVIWTLESPIYWAVIAGLLWMAYKNAKKLKDSLIEVQVYLGKIVF